jgi:beta-lactamase regulating signal transducer with metallopeptidase domain
MALVEIAVRAALMLFVAFLATYAMKPAAAATRHLVWTLAVVAALIVPFVSAVVPPVEMVPNPADVVGPYVRYAIGGDLGTRGVLPAEVGRDEVHTSQEQDTPSSGLRRAVSISWAGIALVLLGRVALGIRAVRRLVGHARPADSRWRALLEEASDAADITRRARLLVSDDIAVPMTWGGRRPALLLPREALQWSDERARLVLLHELAHVRRADWLTHALARILAALHWFNPLAWIALRAMTRERERACDDFVLARGARPSEYAQHLLAIARDGIGGPAYAVAPAMARASELEGRLLSILTPRRREPRPAVTHALIAAAVCLTVTVAGASSRLEEPAPGHVPSSSRPVTTWLLTNDDTQEEKQQARRERGSLGRLARTAVSDVSDDAREKATMALAVRSEPEVVDPLLRALQDPSSQVREKAALGLALRRDPRVVESLIAAANDADSQVREKVAIALGLSGDPRAIDALNTRLDDPDPQVREKAASGLTLLPLSSLVRRSPPR